ncbi:3'5'-cyclic nucleotide phosphodiesterase, catalytic domain,3'5'-cyclic nucleotide phosphodiesterase [Cinara cedri]|uniref:Phosphodiesterase n=1 Tax=Cinara cedri TaxID=506608 RepID=A0A5E4MBB7_9HEMI|nr:3'5'-cyclic nucleotide phosphodiesterase, catalytic domain,3'5'-cyclic nucleotide phosphodiesterase [Cinara cedri]
MESQTIFAYAFVKGKFLCTCTRAGQNVRETTREVDCDKSPKRFILAGPPEPEGGAGTSQDNMALMERNEGTHDDHIRHGGLTIVRRSSQKRSSYFDEYTMALSREAESMLGDVDLSIEGLPSIDTTEAIDKAALRLRCVLLHLRKGQISAEILHRNLFFAAKVLETAFVDEDPCSPDAKQKDTGNAKPGVGLTQNVVAMPTVTPPIRQKRLRTPIWARRLAAEEEDELSEVQPDAVPQEVREWLASTFTRQMACTRRRGEDKPKFKSVAHAIRAGIFVDRMYRKVVSTPLMLFPTDVVKTLKKLNEWSFDVYQLHNYGNGQPIKYLGYDLLNRYGIFQKFKVPSVIMENFLSRIEEGYSRHKNPYHNNLHGADVAQTVHYMLCQTGLMNWLSDLEIFAMLIAAITHDFEHTGTTNNFHVMSGTEIALLYNDRAVLENYHISSTFRILKDEDCNILQNLTKEEYREFRTLVIDMVLATDMSYHFQQLKIMKALIASPEPTIDKSKAMSMVLHCADISHPAKEWNMHYRWTSQLLEEFFLQGDMEKKLGLPFSPLCDRNNTLIAESQIGFIEFIVEPSMAVCSEMLELILGPINIVNTSKNNEKKAVTPAETKEDESSQSDVAKACTAMSCNIEDTKEEKDDIDVTATTSDTIEPAEKSEKDKEKEKTADKPEDKLFQIKKPWIECLTYNKLKWKIQAVREAKLRESKTKYTMADILIPLPGEMDEEEFIALSLQAEKDAKETAENASKETDENASKETDENASIETDENASKQIDEKETSQTDEGTLKTDEKEILQTVEKETLLTDEKEILQTDEKEKLQTDEKEMLQTDEKEMLQTDEKKTLKTDEKEILQTDEKETLQTDGKASSSVKVEYNE